MGQTYQSNSDLPSPSADDYTVINFGIMSGGYDDYISGGCGDPSYTVNYKYVTTGIGVSHIKFAPGNKHKNSEFRLGLSFGSDKPTLISGPHYSPENKTVIAI